LHQKGWLLEAWRNLGSDTPNLSRIDQVILLMESRFPASIFPKPENQTAESLFRNRITSLFEMGAALLHRGSAPVESDESERQIFLALAVTLGDGDTARALQDRSARIEATALVQLENQLSRLVDGTGEGLIDSPFKQLLWRRGARRFAFTLEELQQGTFSILSALMGFEQELESRRTMVQCLATFLQHESSQEERERGYAHIELLKLLAGTPKATLHVTPSESELLKSLSARIGDTGDRALLLGEFFYIAYMNNALSDTEVEALDRIASSLNVTAEKRLEIQSSVLHSFTRQTTSHVRFSITSLIDRTRQATTHIVERLIKKNAHAIANEVRETGDLMALFVKSTSAELNPEEQARMKDQLHDLCRAVPCLALFAAPGGSLLIPVLQKLLPINILPSSFLTEESDDSTSKSPTREELPVLKLN
jgi:hypothetical protein